MAGQAASESRTGATTQHATACILWVWLLARFRSSGWRPLRHQRSLSALQGTIGNEILRETDMDKLDAIFVAVGACQPEFAGLCMLRFDRLTSS